jgi:hypothetical protein
MLEENISTAEAREEILEPDFLSKPIRLIRADPAGDSGNCSPYVLHLNIIASFSNLASSGVQVICKAH